MRILIVSQYFRPQPLANAEAIGAIAFGLAELGHEVDVITPVADAEVADRLKAYRAFGWFSENRSSKARRAAEYLAFSIGAIARALTVPHPDIVFVPSPPPTLGAVGLIISRLRRAPLVYNVQDLYPEVAIATGAISPGFLLKLLGRLMQITYRGAAAVVMIDPLFIAGLERACPNARIEAIRNGIDLAPFDHAARSDAFLSELGVPPGAAVVMYAGNVGRSQDLAAVVAAVGRAGAHLVIHGGGATLDSLRNEVSSAGHRHVHFSGYRDRSELGAIFASADVHVVPLKVDVASASVPSKLLSIFAAGRPAIVTAEDDTAAALVLQEAGGGWLVHPAEPEKLAVTISAVLQDREELARRGTRARKWAVANAGSERCAREYADLFVDLLQSPRNRPR